MQQQQQQLVLQVENCVREYQLVSDALQNTDLRKKITLFKVVTYFYVYCHLYVHHAPSAVTMGCRSNGWKNRCCKGGTTSLRTCEPT